MWVDASGLPTKTFAQRSSLRGSFFVYQQQSSLDESKITIGHTASPPIQGMPQLWSFIDTKSVQEESTSNQKPMRPLALISAASLLLLAAFWLSPQATKAQWQGVNEKKWVESIESDIRNKASAQDICINSTNFATISKEIAFKD